MTKTEIWGPVLVGVVIAAAIVLLIVLPVMKESQTYCQYLQDRHPDRNIRWESPKCLVLVGDHWYSTRWVFPRN